MSKICVYVPTYHRPLSLGRCLLSIIEESKRYEGTVKIYVSNNDKNDQKTKKIIFAFKEIYDYLEYEENEENLGIDGNMEKPFKGLGGG